MVETKSSNVLDLRGSKITKNDEMKSLEAFAARIRFHSIRSIAKACSGHPGACLSMAEAISVLYGKHMRLDHNNPDNPNNDLFVLSKGHAAPALYTALASVGFFPIGDIDHLRCIDSHLQGHPDMTKTPGITMSTGRLGAGFGAAIGMAIEATLRRSDVMTFVGLGDGEISEGICWEAMGLAGKLKLNRLVVLYDCNGLGLGGSVSKYSEWNIPVIAEQMGWKTIIVNGHDVCQLNEAVNVAKASENKPVFIFMETVKGRGVSFMENNPDWHGKSTNPDQTKQALDEIAKYMDEPLVEKLMEKRKQNSVDQTKRPSFQPLKIDYDKWKKNQPTRKVFGEWLLDAMDQLNNGNIISVVPIQADVAKCVMTNMAEEKFGLINDGLGRCLDVGIREQLMIAIMAGIARGGFFIPIGATFASFVEMGLDLARQLFAKNKLPGILIGTHSGLQVAGDGASHMDLTSLRSFGSIPGIRVIEPGDPYSAAKLLTYAFNSQHKNPGLVYIRLTRSEVPYIKNSQEEGSNVKFMEDVEPEKGYRVIVPSSAHNTNKVSIVASGAFLDTAIKVAQIINSRNLGFGVSKVIEAFAPTDFGRFYEASPDILSGSEVVATMIDASPETLATPVIEYLFRTKQNPQFLSFGADFHRARSGSIHEVYSDQGLLPEQIAERIIQVFENPVVQKTL